MKDIKLSFKMYNNLTKEQSEDELGRFAFVYHRPFGVAGLEVGAKVKFICGELPPIKAVVDEIKKGSCFAAFFRLDTKELSVCNKSS